MSRPDQVNGGNPLLVFEHAGEMRYGASQGPVAESGSFPKLRGLNGCRSSRQEVSPGSGVKVKSASKLLRH